MTSDNSPLVALGWMLTDASCAVVFTALSVVVPSALLGYTPGAFGAPTLVLSGLYVYLKLSEALFPPIATAAEQPYHEALRASEESLPISDGVLESGTDS